MKIELKNIQHSEALSQETEAFKANIFIDGRHAGYARNEGNGGSTDIYPKDPADGDLLKKAGEFGKTLPPRTYELEGEQHSVPMNLETVVDDLLSQHLEEKRQKQFERKIQKAMTNGIIFGVPGGDSLTVIGFKTPLDKLLTYPLGIESIKQAIKRNILTELRDGEKVLNTNIPENILKDAGLNADQYNKPVTGKQRKQDRPQAKSTRKGI